ncbi:hypothetical protein CEXT_75121, partial [Caerostris extrusa]
WLSGEGDLPSPHGDKKKLLTNPSGFQIRLDQESEQIEKNTEAKRLKKISTSSSEWRPQDQEFWRNRTASKKTPQWPDERVATDVALPMTPVHTGKQIMLSGFRKEYILAPKDYAQSPKTTSQKYSPGFSRIPYENVCTALKPRDGNL